MIVSPVGGEFTNRHQGHTPAIESISAAGIATRNPGFRPGCRRFLPAETASGRSRVETTATASPVQYLPNVRSCAAGIERLEAWTELEREREIDNLVRRLRRAHPPPPR